MAEALGAAIISAETAAAVSTAHRVFSCSDHRRYGSGRAAGSGPQPQLDQPGDQA